MLSHDPNYKYDTDEEEEEDEMETDDFDELVSFTRSHTHTYTHTLAHTHTHTHTHTQTHSEEDDEYSDDDDVSWKVRRAAAKCLAAILGSRPELVGRFYQVVSPVLITRFKGQIYMYISSARYVI